MPLRSLLPWSLLLVLLAACPSGDDDDSSDDDDSVADDDDTTDDDDSLADDDDSLADDDDSAGPPSRCDELLNITEVEPNDDPDVAQVLGEAPDEGFCLQGSITCGAFSYEDVDLLRFSLPRDRDVQLVLRWSGASDLDAYLWIADEFQLNGSGFLVGWENGTSSPEVGSDLVQGGLDHLLQVACYDGVGGAYSLEVTWSPLSAGDDDDSAGDDDDSVTPDDDDSAADDDDSAADDDDSAADDDDSATPDDDDSAAPDDDDSATQVADDDDSSAVL